MNIPTVDKKIFLNTTNRENIATISSPFFRSKYWEYEIAYKQAGDILVDKSIENGSLFKEVSIYPIMFIYRQFLELYIKDILMRFDIEFDSNSKPYNGHDVYLLWGKLQDIVIHYQGEFPAFIDEFAFDEVLRATDAYLVEISKNDFNSMSFRYPDNKNHTQNYFPKERPVDLVNIKERINELANILCLIEETLVNNQMLEEEMDSFMQ